MPDETPVYNQHQCNAGDKAKELQVEVNEDALVESHAIIAARDMFMSGALTSRCRDVYRGLVEIAEAVRLRNNFEPYVPQGNIAARLRQAIDVTEEQVLTEERQRAQTSVVALDDPSELPEFLRKLKVVH